MSQEIKLPHEAQRKLLGILAASGLTERARTRIMEVVSQAALLELRIRRNEETRDLYSGDNSYDARKSRENARDLVASTRRRLWRQLDKLERYAESRGDALIAALDGLASLGKSAEQLACEAVANGLAPFLKRSTCAKCGDCASVPYASRTLLCRDCAYYMGACLNRMCAGMLPHVANRVAPLLRSVDADGVPGCACGDPECSQCGTPQAADVLQHNRCATAGAVTVAEYERGDLTDDERDAFTL
jgi:hypothetical protein